MSAFFEVRIKLVETYISDKGYKDCRDIILSEERIKCLDISGIKQVILNPGTTADLADGLITKFFDYAKHKGE